MCAGSVLGGNPLFRGPEIPGRGGPADRRGGEDAPRGQLRRLRIRRMPGHGRRAREARRHLGALLPRGRRRLYESRGCIPRKGRCRKAARSGDRPLRRTCEKRPRTNEYNGAKSCAVASSLYVGETGCAFGCLGFGDCVAVCAFDAIHINPETGLPEVDADKCTACGACVKACPK